MLSFLFTLLAFLAVLSIVVVIHELGHYWVARWCGVKIDRFSVGFGPELWHRIDRHGTRWRIAAFPLGGYVKWAGDENAASMPDRAAIEAMSPEERAGSFYGKPVWQRAAIVAAGPMANFLSAILLFAGIFYINGERVAEPRVGRVIQGSAAEAAGFQVGDLIVAINGKAISSFEELGRAARSSGGDKLKFEVMRGNARQQLEATPVRTEDDDGLGGKQKTFKLGIASQDGAAAWQRRQYSILDSVGRAVGECANVIGETLRYISNIFKMKESGDQIGGPVKIAQVSGKMASLGISPLIYWIAFISVSVGLANLFPIPLLDGGHLVFYAYEAVVGKPLNERTQEYAFRFGLAVLLFLFVFANINDFGLRDWLSGSPAR